MYVRKLFSEVYDEADVQLASGQVIGDGVLLVVDVRNPIIRTYILDIKQVKDIQSQPDVF